ncbi:MAG: FCD domain-containing protein [Vannielia sp.]|nr:FCD domain-containing protein [Oceanicola sp. 502str15]MCO6381118.1 FCD domain-containing protein [Oceanicola sp. 502str15]
MIAQTLIGEIRAGVIAADSPLPTERSLCSRFETSRPTVREALALMQMRGYISGGGGRRPRATLPSLLAVLQGAGGMIREILGDDESGAHIEQMRNFIETGAVREAATRADPLQAAKIRAALEANFGAIGTPDFAATDIAFHRAIVAGIGNPVMLTLHDMFLSEMLAARPPETDRSAHDRVVYEEHRGIYEAVLAGDPAAATEVMEKHLYRSWRSRLADPKPANPPD